MPSRIKQLHFRKYSKRGPLSSVVMDDGVGDEDVITVFWNELGLYPVDEEEANTLLSRERAIIIGKAQDTTDLTVEKGVLRDSTRRSDWQRKVVKNLTKKAGWQ